MNLIRLIPVFFIVFNVNIHGQIGAKVQQKNNIYAVWQSDQYGIQMTLMLNQDGSGEFDGEPFTFTIKDNKLMLKSGPEVVTYAYVLNDNSLTLSGGDLNEDIIFHRNNPQFGTNATNIVNPNPISPQLSQASDGSNDIIGIWSGNGEIIEFKPDGQCSYLGQIFPYQVSQGHVTLIAAEGSAMFQYSITGDRLTLTFNNQKVVYTRGASHTGNTAMNAKQNNTGQGQVAQELVGTWCFIDVNSYNQGGSSTSECITLNGDGTYSYESESSRSVNTPDFYGGTNSQGSDRGTWYVQGDRIYYNSQTQGQGSYLLEKRNHPKNVNDPMIVLDGRAFVTQYNKPPWR
jgi:hypothetical protein